MYRVYRPPFIIFFDRVDYYRRAAVELSAVRCVTLSKSAYEEDFEEELFQGFAASKLCKGSL